MLQWTLETDVPLEELDADRLRTHIRLQRERIDTIKAMAVNEIMGHEECSGCYQGRLAMLETFGLEAPSRKRFVVGYIEFADDTNLDTFEDSELDSKLTRNGEIETADMWMFDADDDVVRILKKINDSASGANHDVRFTVADAT